ncbi:MAG: glycosyltransferase, partial [Waterburya sp.]
WRLVKKYTKIIGCTHCLLMFFDSLLWRMSFGIKPSCSISSIFFRPISHYRNFDNYLPSSREHFWEFREKIGLSRILTSGRIENFFCLDPLAVDYFSKLDNKTNIVYLPDPVQTYNTSLQQVKNLNQHLGIEIGRKVFLLFGSLSKRKGICELLEAIKNLSFEFSRQLCLLIVGPFEEQELQESTLIEIKNICQSQAVQIICHNEFVIDSQIEPYFKIADFILAPYQHHVGMSAILVRAAAANKPVLSSDFGLMGEVTRRSGLGIVVDSEKSTSIADGLALCLTKPTASLCDYEKMKQFAEQNKAEKFATTIFQNILS